VVSSTALGWLGLGPIHQIGIVTEDLDRSIARRRQTGPTSVWNGWTYGPDFVQWQRIGAAAAAFEIRLAVSGNNPQLELMQPLAGDTSLSRTLSAARSRGLPEGSDVFEALHHLGLFVTDFAGESDRLLGMGIRRLESGGGHGLDGDGSFGYFDTTDQLGVFVELIQPPARRPAPHFVVGGDPAGLSAVNVGEEQR
jgi:methylmalonyl-CoA/ethylmalonyl-CoA epimerase